MLHDRFNRLITYLRIRVTDRCNFRCVYCMPAQGIEIAPRVELLTFEEIARVSADLGVHKIRLTVGEPTVRRDSLTLVAVLNSKRRHFLVVKRTAHFLRTRIFSANSSG